MMVRHATPKLDAVAALARANVDAADQAVTKLVWVPFVLHQRRPALAPESPIASLPLPERCPLYPGVPEGVCLESAPGVDAPLVYFPFWRVDTLASERFVSAIDGVVTETMRVESAPAVAPRIGYVITVGLLGTFFLFSTSFLGYLAIQVVTLIAHASDVGSVDGTKVLSGTPIGATSVLGLVFVWVLSSALVLRFARGVFEPAIAEAVGGPDVVLGPAGARLAKYTAIVASIGVGVSLAASQGPSSSVAGFVCGTVGLGWLGLEGLLPWRVPDRDAYPTHPLIRETSNALVFFVVTVLLNYVIFMSGGYDVLSRAFETPFESNDFEGVLLTAIAALALAMTSLPKTIKFPVVAALLAGLAAKPLGIPFVTIVLQFVVVSIVSVLVDDGPKRSTADAVVRGLATEAGIVAGVLFGRFVLTLLVGTPGWTIGGVAGECIGGVLAARAQEGEVEVVGEGPRSWAA